MAYKVEAIFVDSANQSLPIPRDLLPVEISCVIEAPDPIEAVRKAIVSGYVPLEMSLVAYPEFESDQQTVMCYCMIPFYWDPDYDLPLTFESNANLVRALWADEDLVQGEAIYEVNEVAIQ